MSDKTAIEWTDATWNPVTGCNQVSSGCAFCYAKRLHDQRFKAWSSGRWPSAPEQYHAPFETVTCHPERLGIPMGWKKPRKIFVNSMSDLFHSSVQWDFLDRVFATMFTCNSHTFQVLTKRAAGMKHYMSCSMTPWRIAARCFRDYVQRAGCGINAWPRGFHFSLSSGEIGRKRRSSTLSRPGISPSLSKPPTKSATISTWQMS